MERDLAYAHPASRASAPNGAPASAGSGTRPFVGRERELDELQSALRDARGGRGSLYLLTGEPGIGKTRLAAVLSDEARAQGVRVAWGRCWENGGAPAYWPWIQV